MRNLVGQNRARSQRGAELLAAFSYRGVLARGFALVRDDAGRPLRSAATVDPGMAIDIEFADGRVGARADAASATPRADSAKARPRRGGASGQGNLF
jgi:exodeoxyribonuclease VII large subunit